LTSVTIPSSVKNIGDGAFRNCPFTCINWDVTVTRTIVNGAMPTKVAC